IRAVATTVDVVGALTAISFGGITSANLVDNSANEDVSGNWTFDNSVVIGNAGFASKELNIWAAGEQTTRLMLSEGATMGLWGLSLRYVGAGNFWSLRRHDNSADGVAVMSGTRTSSAVNFPGALTALSYGGITEANLLDKIAAETIAGAWNFPDAGIFIEAKGKLYHSGNTLRIQGLVNSNTFQLSMANSAGIEKALLFGDPNAGTGLYFAGGEKIVTLAGGVSITGDVGGTTIGGITEANLVDKTAAEDITGAWTFTVDPIIAEGVDINLAGPGGGRMRCESQSLADDATGTFTTEGDHKFCILVTNFDTTTMASWFHTRAQNVLILGQGSLCSIDNSVNPDTDTHLNVWGSGNTEISIKNRLGSTRTITLYTFSI
ncbi:hypothetical protein LCGC14_2869580, partial [marine sediment metagenome]